MDKSSSLYEHEERRLHTRLKINTPVEIYGEKGVIKAKISNISRGGLQILSNNDLLNEHYLLYKDLTENNSSNAEVVFNLRYAGKNEGIKAGCRTIYYLNLSGDTQENIIIGLQYINFINGNTGYIDDFLYSRDNDSYLVI